MCSIGIDVLFVVTNKICCPFPGQCIGTLRGHEDEVLDVSFDLSGHYLLTASADSTARVYNATTHQLVSRLVGHEGEISKVSF